ncbi:uncharacterized protein LOC131850860 isoform X2 [Achroia grisella]|uniref:uncharacterized protein LOC131850860 isoform X2 n=1 Tax=Achroia grisella TaxID=688607 RepID=UPI0027D25453|nr:uncharacterized protein LOC131850860 isoform X2 [Achroia grisella]
MADSIKTLIKKRSSMKSKITVFNNYLNLISSNADISHLQRLDLEERFNRFEAMYSDFDALQTDIEVLSDDAEAESALTDREEFERQFFRVVALARSLLATSRDSAGSVAGSEDANSGALNTKQNFVRLPKISLPCYDGFYQSWLEFRDTYISLIHNNACIDDINKFHYLRASLKGSAASIIQNIDFKAEHYKIAWDLLCERYNNNRVLVNNHIQALFDVEQISRESSVSLRGLVDVINKNIRALTTLNQPTNHWDTLIIFIMAKKLDVTTSRNWEEHKNSLTTDPILSQFCTFLNKRADLLESVESNFINCSTSIVALNNQTNNNKSIITHNKKSIAYNKQSGIKCPLCSQAHSLYSCESFRALSIENRIQKAKEYKVCLNCLRLGHNAKYCKLTHCKYCKVKHNTLLHIEINSTIPSHDVLPSASPSLSNDVALSADTMQLATSAHCLLSTALVNVTNATGNKCTARLLLDNGSTANFVTQSLSEKLGLSQRGKNKMVPFIRRGETWSSRPDQGQDSTSATVVPGSGRKDLPWRGRRHKGGRTQDEEGHHSSCLQLHLPSS